VLLPGLNRRTYQLLRRFLATEWKRTDDGPWTYGRLARIRGFGMAALLNVLEAERGAPSGKSPPVAQPGQPIIFIVRSRSRIHRIPRPALERALTVIARALPAGQSEIDEALARAGLAELGLQEVERAARLLAEPPSFAVLRRDRVAVAVPPDRLALAATTHAIIRRAVLYHGLASARRVAMRIGTSDVRFVRIVAGAHPGCRWLDRTGNWFWYREDAARLLRELPRSPLPERLRAAVLLELQADAFRPAVRAAAAARR
jgi:hypothetical protein